MNVAAVFNRHAIFKNAAWRIQSAAPFAEGHRDPARS
jgi:hypothetical protein